MTPAEARNILGVSQHSSRKEIKAAHRELVFQFHPDKAGKSEERRKRYEEKMKKINVARDVLVNLSRSSSNSQRRHSDTSKNTNQKDYDDAHEYQRWREEQRRKSSAGKEEQERRKEEWKKYNKKTGERGKYYPAKNDSVKRGQILLGIIVIISVLFIINPFSNQSEIEPPSVEQPPVIEAPVIEQPRSIEEQPVVKQAVVDVPPPVEVVPTIEIVPIRSIILTGECGSNAKEWGRENGRSEHAITEHIIFFGMYENVCAKAVVVFDLNKFEGLEINSMTFTFNDKIGSYGRTCHGDGFWTVSNARTCLEPTDSELKYNIQDSLSCVGDVFQESENWQSVNSWINPSGSATISLDSIAVGEGRYLCMAFSQKGADIATENDNYFRIWAIGDLRIEVMYD